jgi:hypothetical protein
MTTPIQCTFVRTKRRINVCSRCGFVDRINVHPPEDVHRDCDVQTPGLGDYVAKAIETVLPWTKKKKCVTCKQRQEWINALGRKIAGRG